MKYFFRFIFIVLLAGCAAQPSTPDASVSTPDRIATRVAEERAVAATLTASAPTPVAPTPEALITEAGPTETPGAPAEPTETPVASATPEPTQAPTTPPTRAPATPIPASPTPVEEVYAVIAAAGNPNGLQGEVQWMGGPKGRSIKPPPTYKTGFTIRMAVYDPNKGKRDGAGIKQVTFRISGPDGDVYEHTETKPHFCLFGGGEPKCNFFTFAKSNYLWPKSDANVSQAQRRMVNGEYNMNIDVSMDNGDSANWNFTFIIAGVR